ncbi:MAG: hypothetical protein AVDCRST_MAG38-1291 [uncultured Solirubrobacteraceae bacterium]|uniref:Uncharacterized protein n=1 Tax=uncultured Solirubrobacteraceae bacterium TaxID=1162706 RepID=A0A6J4RKF0_9ACTN|nr:MAG: hypothetical protein AVDCRST_MAG38-1291 [uncultured Solirubrobacteraceae bacterium]
MRLRRRSAAAADPAGGLAALGFVGGLAVGVLAWSWPLEAFSRNLFSASKVRRYAALGYLGGRPSVDTARLLRDYIRWERHPLLRRRGEQVLRQVERYLD